MSKIRLIILSLSAVFAVSIVAASSASALEFYFAGGTLVPSLTNIVSKAASSQKLKGQIGGIASEVVCNKLDVNGSIHNGLGPGEMLMGLGLVLLLYLECNLASGPAGCKLKEASIHAVAEVLTVTIGGIPYVEFKPDNSTKFATFELESCSTGTLNGLYSVLGTDDVEVNAAHELEATLTDPGTLKLAGNAATYMGNDTPVTETGAKELEVK